jgi:hypothetical protein
MAIAIEDLEVGSTDSSGRLVRASAARNGDNL